MNKEIDLRGKQCPIPVIQTKKALEKTGSGSIVTIVDNDTAKENISKLAKSMNLKAEIKEAKGDFYIEIYKQGDIQISEGLEFPSKSAKKEDLTILITRDTLGEGDRELGEVLMKGYIYTLTEATKTPRRLLFLNGGVKLTVEGSLVIDHLRKLEEKGVEILSCGACLDYYKVKNQLLVGGIGNMYDIVEKSNGAAKTITL
jgi:selenium metabolism protein YedF